MFVGGFIVDLLMQHEFHCVKLISKESTKIEQKNACIRHLIRGTRMEQVQKHARDKARIKGKEIKRLDPKNREN